MSSPMPKCLFCQEELHMQMYMSDCDKCNMQYMHVDYRIWGEWVLVHQDYIFKDINQKYHALDMDLREQKSTLWIYNEPYGDSFNMYKIVIPRIFPDTKPHEALRLAERLHKLIAFS